MLANALMIAQVFSKHTEDLQYFVCHDTRGVVWNENVFAFVYNSWCVPNSFCN